MAGGLKSVINFKMWLILGVNGGRWEDKRGGWGYPLLIVLSGEECNRYFFLSKKIQYFF